MLPRERSIAKSHVRDGLGTVWEAGNTKEGRHSHGGLFLLNTLGCLGKEKPCKAQPGSEQPWSAPLPVPKLDCCGNSWYRTVPVLPSLTYMHEMGAVHDLHL